MFMDRQSDDATTSTKPTTDTTDDDLVDDIMGQFDVDFDTLCVHVAERKQEELKAEGKHPHHRPTKKTANHVVAPPGDVRHLLGDKVKTIGGTPYEVKHAGTTPAPTDVDIDGIIYLVKMADCVYRVSTNNHSEATGALIDRGANGGIAGNNCRVIEVNDQPHRYVNVEGIDGHVMERRRLVTAGAVTHSNRGPVILIMHQYAHSGKGHSIHSLPQLEWNGVNVNDKSARVGGKQRLVTFDGFSIPINIRGGLPYIDMRPHTDQEWEELPHVLLTEDANWDPTHMDHEQGDDPAWFEQQDDPPLLNSDLTFVGTTVIVFFTSPILLSIRIHLLVESLFMRMMYSLTLQGMNHLLTLTPMDTMAPTWILRWLPTIVSSGLMLIAMYAVQMQTLMQILVQVTMDHARYRRHHVITMHSVLVSPGSQPTSSRRLSRSPPIMHGCLSILSFANVLSLPILRSTYDNVMNW
jgi:hypothetical protein